MSKDTHVLTLAYGRKGNVVMKKFIRLEYVHDNENVIYSVRQMASEAGFSKTEEVMIATAASELATNILRYAGTGDITICIIRETAGKRMGMELFAADNGPGIENLEQAMRENYSSIPSSLGLGLPSVRRIMDEFYIESVPGVGTRVLAYKWR